METFEKVDNTLKVVKEETTQEENTYDLDFLKKQLIDITTQRDEFVEARNKEIKEVEDLISKCNELGVKSEVALAKEKVAVKEVLEVIK